MFIELKKKGSTWLPILRPFGDSSTVALFHPSIATPNVSSFKMEVFGLISEQNDSTFPKLSKGILVPARFFFLKFWNQYYIIRTVWPPPPPKGNIFQKNLNFCSEIGASVKVWKYLLGVGGWGGGGYHFWNLWAGWNWEKNSLLLWGGLTICTHFGETNWYFFNKPSSCLGSCDECQATWNVFRNILKVFLKLPRKTLWKHPWKSWNTL